MRERRRNSRTSSKVTASVVLYRQRPDDVRPLFESLTGENVLSAWAVVNNGGARDACALAGSMGAQVIDAAANLGYGGGNNLAARRMMHLGQYHLFVNPDIRFPPGALEELCIFMDRHLGVGQVMPRILYADGSSQQLCKMLPGPWDLLLRRFMGASGQAIFRARRDAYEMRNVDLSIAREVPCLSGCFMFIRTAALETVGLFDERFFMYMEDVDLCRRIAGHYQTAFFPQVSIFHGYKKGSYSSLRLLRLHIRSATRYFNKWGWFHDEERDRLNSRVAPIDE